MPRHRLSKSVRKYLRKEKSRMRRGRFSDSSEATGEIEAKIQELVQKMFGQYNRNKKIEVRK